MNISLKFSFFIFLAAFFTLAAAHSASAVVDLRVNSITVSPESPAKAENTKITVKVLNNGDQALMDQTGFDYKLTIDDFEQSTVSEPKVSADSPLEPTKTREFVFQGSFYSTGEKKIYFQIDYFDELDEWKEGNNSIVKNITVLKPYDLSLESIKVTPESPAVGQDCYITVTAKNSGYSSLKTGTGVSSISYDFADFVQTSQVLPEINTMNNVDSGETFVYKFYGHFDREGEAPLSFTIDKNDQMDEQSESNNTLEKTATIVSPLAIDLAVSSISLDKDKPLLNDEVTVTVKVKNEGLVTLINDKGLRYNQDLSVYPAIQAEAAFESDNFKQTGFSAGAYPTAATPLEPGDVYEYKYTGLLLSKPGEHTFSFRVNTNDRLPEEKKANNSLAKTVYVYENAAERDSFELSGIKAEFYSATSARISWQTSQKAASHLDYKRWTFTGWKTTSESTGLAHSRDLKNLVEGFLYDYRIFAAYGTISREETELKFDLPDESTVHITAGPDLTVNGQNITVDWDTDLLAQATLYYRPKYTEDFTAVKNSSYNTAHQAEVKNLAFGEYEYFAANTANTGQKTESKLKDFIIQNPSASPVSTSTAQVEDVPEPASRGEGEETAPADGNTAEVKNREMYNNLRGKIVLTVEQNGEAYYINPEAATRHYLGRPDDAFQVMREQGIGVSNGDLYKIPVGLGGEGADSDGDGISDYLEETLGLDGAAADTDGDGFGDYEELTAGYNPWGAGSQDLDGDFTAAQAGRILLQVEKNGEAWYVNPADNKRYFLGRPADAFSIMRQLGLGISNQDFGKLDDR